MTDHSRTQDMLANLRAAFVTKMLDRMILIENASVHLGSHPEDSAAMGIIRRECHKLSGVSSSLGFTEIGERATEIDCAISLQAQPWSVLQPKVDALLDVMEAELD